MTAQVQAGDLAPVVPGLSVRRPPANFAIWIWLALGFAGYLVLPWYAVQDANGLTAIPDVFGGDDKANGLMQVFAHGRVWLALGLAGLAVAAAGAMKEPGRKQGTLLLCGGLLGAVGLALSGFLIGAKGWNSQLLASLFGELGKNQFGIGWGGFVALAALVVLAAFGVARRGFFKGDLFIAASVISCGTRCGSGWRASATSG